jgi:cytochrome c oxidase cbb3-type subunit III
MNDFVSNFWPWYIFIITAASIAWCFYLVMSQSHGMKDKDHSIKPTGHKWDEDLEELNTPLPRWWQQMFIITNVFAVVYLLLYPGSGIYDGLLGWSSADYLKNGATGQYETEMAAADTKYSALYDGYLKEDIVNLTSNKAAIITGGRLFSTYCIQCHGSDAGGAPGFPNLRDSEWLWGGEPAQIKQTIAGGRLGAMPAWGPVLGDDARSVAAYVLSLSGKKTSGDLDVGKEKFQQLCVACHGAEGKGNFALGAPDLTDNKWLYGGSARSVEKSIVEGRNGRMPSFGDFLGDAKVHLLAAYVYSLSY